MNSSAHRLRVAPNWLRPSQSVAYTVEREMALRVRGCGFVPASLCRERKPSKFNISRAGIDREKSNFHERKIIRSLHLSFSSAFLFFYSFIFGAILDSLFTRLFMRAYFVRCALQSKCFHYSSIRRHSNALQ